MTSEYRHPTPIGHVARILAAPLAVALLLSVLTVGPARAWDSGCSIGDFCVYSDWYRGGWVAATPNDVQVYSGNFPGSAIPINNNASSAHNRKTVDVYLYQGFEFTGGSICIDSGYIDDNFGVFYNDTFSSHNVVSSDGFC